MICRYDIPNLNVVVACANKKNHIIGKVLFFPGCGYYIFCLEGKTSSASKYFFSRDELSENEFYIPYVCVCVHIAMWLLKKAFLAVSVFFISSSFCLRRKQSGQVIVNFFLVVVVVDFHGTNFFAPLKEGGHTPL